MENNEEWEDETEHDFSSILVFLVIAGFVIWVGSNVYSAFECEAEEYFFESKENIKAFFRIIFQGRR
ncbi:MAG: hypothetical protein K1060chlam2_01028 [Chlamydiae bacterium]|nr:hypothetical protein [Chlamydiota bacterium]